jgi:hypothetical protein
LESPANIKLFTNAPDTSFTTKGSIDKYSHENTCMLSLNFALT